MLLSEQAYQRIDKELIKFPADQKRSAIMAALAIAQQELGWLSTDLMREVAEHLDQPPVAVQQVATFYDMFNTQPVGQYKITVCTNLPCALREGVQTMEYLKDKLGISAGETTEDGMFTLTEGECMGSCGDSPVLLVNDRHMCVHMQPERIDAMIEELKRKSEETP
ncbi:MAG TPA: NADH-quinone oxidoreductase subunit NuoE [Burkholderiaceae bacterium]|nr:NADH-quinone oxidoreductase subunit NuoE [Burkholderiaceae bacterium]